MTTAQYLTFLGIVVFVLTILVGLALAFIKDVKRRVRALEIVVGNHVSTLKELQAKPSSDSSKINETNLNVRDLRREIESLKETYLHPWAMAQMEKRKKP